MSFDHNNDEQKQALDFKAYLTQERSPSDHLPRKAGTNKIIWNVMTQSGPQGLDNGTGGFVTEDSTTKEGRNETKEEYEQRLFGDEHPSVKLSIAASVKENPEVEFFLLQETPRVSKDENNTGQKFINETLAKLNEGYDPVKWACTTQYDEPLSKCIFYRCDKYELDNTKEHGEKLSNISNTAKLSSKECFAALFKDKKNRDMQALFNTHLNPGKDEEVPLREAEISTLFEQAHEAFPGIKKTFVGGDCNVNAGIGGQLITPTETSVNTYDEKSAHRVGCQTYKSIDAGFECSSDEFPAFVRSVEKVINPETGKTQSYDAVPKDPAKEDTYGKVLFGHLSRPELKIDTRALHQHLESLPAPERGEPVKINEITIESNVHNAHRIAIKSASPILYYEYLMTKKTPGITVERDCNGLKYCLQLDGDKPAPEEAYNPEKIKKAPLNSLTSEIMARYLDEYRKDISIQKKELASLREKAEQYEKILNQKKEAYHAWAEEKAIADYIAQHPDITAEELKKNLLEYPADVANREIRKLRNEILNQLKEDNEEYKETTHNKESKEKRIRELAKNDPGVNNLYDECDVLQQRQIAMQEAAYDANPQLKALERLSVLRKAAGIYVETHPDVIKANRDVKVNAHDINAASTVLESTKNFADTLTPDARKIRLILAECEAYHASLKESHLFDKDILDNKKLAIEKLISYLKDTKHPDSTRLKEFPNKLNEHKKTLEERNDKAWTKAGKIILSVLFAWTIAVPYTLWKVKEKDRIKKMEDIATKENAPPRQKI